VYTKKIALIPAYEPDVRLVELVEELVNASFKVVIVNDGSSAAYSQRFNMCKDYATIINHPVNMGKGVALKTGLGYIKEFFNGPYTVVTVDADGQHKITDVIRVCKFAQSHPESLILGSRKLQKNTPLRSKVGNYITRKVYQLVSVSKVYDTQTGLRAFSQSLVSRMLEIKGDRYEYEMNVLMHFAKERIDIREIQIETVYIDGNSSSHFNTIKDSVKIYKEILKFSASSFLSFLLDYSLYSVFFLLTGSVLFGNIVARIISGTFNYSINRMFVFDNERPLKHSAPEYFILALLVLAGNTMILGLVVNTGLNPFAGKILAEMLMFVISYIIQRTLIFKKETIHCEKA